MFLTEQSRFGPIKLHEASAIRNFIFPIVILFVGLFAGFYKVPPLPQISYVAKMVLVRSVAIFNGEADANRLQYRLFVGNKRNEYEWFDKVHPAVRATSFRSLVDISDAADIEKKRTALIRYIWATKSLSTERLPHKIDENIFDERFDNLENLKKIDKYTVLMRHELKSVMYHFFPDSHNGKFVIYHQGHGGDFIKGKKIIAKLLDEGYSVIGFALPLFGMNSGPRYFTTRFGPIKNSGHGAFFVLETEDFSPLRYFFDPLLRVVNLVQKKYGASCLAMTGLSGGGWLSAIYPALDRRICRSYPVAGAMPRYVQSFPPNKSDRPRLGVGGGEYEFIAPAFRTLVNYPELFVMSAFGRNRKMIQIFNKYDTCCARGIGVSSYVADMKSILADLGEGAYEQYIDETHVSHAISDSAISLILADLATMN